MKEINTQEIYDNMGEVSNKNAVKYIAVTKQVVEFNICRYNTENRPQQRVWKDTTMKHINVLCKAVVADAKNSIGSIAQT